MRSDFQLAADSFVREVEREAVSLIEQGEAPWQAMRIAREIVQERRRRESRPA